MTTPPHPAVPVTFRCSTAAAAREDDLAGTATHLAAFLLVEHHGPWGVSAPRDSRLPASVGAHLASRRGLRVLMARHHRRADRGATGLRLFLAVPRRRLLLSTTFGDPRELLDVGVDALAAGELPDWPEAPGPVYGVCTHGRHDVCCAERGRPVAAALTGIRPAQTWEVSHIGGDRFSANMVVLPDGLYYGRLDADSVTGVVTRHESGRLDLERLRGRTTYPMSVQYAEIALRRHLAEDRLDGLRLEQREGDTSIFRHGDRRWAVAVRTALAEPARLTCGAERLNPVPVHQLTRLEQI